MSHFAPFVIFGLGFGAGRCPGTDDHATEMSRPLCRLRFPFQTALPFGQLVRLSPRDCAPCAFEEKPKVRSDAVLHPKHQLHCRIAKPPFNQAQHGFGDARTLGEGVLGELSAFALSLQTPNNLFSDGLVMSDSGHDEGLQQKTLDAYIAMVKYRRGWSSESDLRANTLLQIFHTIETKHY